MRIKVYLKKDDAVRLGLEPYGELDVELDLAKLTQEQRDYLAPTQAASPGLELDHKYTVEGSIHWKLFPPTPEGVTQLLEFAVEKNRVYRAYQEKVNAERKAQEEAEKKREEERREKLVAHLLTLNDDDFLEQAARVYIEVPGEGVTIQGHLVLNDPRLQPQMERRNATLAEIKRQGDEEKARRNAEASAKAERKRQQIVDWVAAHGTESQQKRQAAGLLDEQEVVDAIRDAAYQPLAEFPLYERLTASNVEHSETCYYHDDIEFSAEDSYATEPVFAQLEQMRALLPAATITPRVHEAHCPACDLTTRRYSLLVKLAVGDFEFTRDYAAPPPTTEE